MLSCAKGRGVARWRRGAGCLGAHLVRQGIGPGVYPAQTRAVSVPDRLSGTAPDWRAWKTPPCRPPKGATG